MTDYTERINALREHADLIETSIELYGPSATRLLVYDLRNAAAAIEALEDELADENSECDYLVNENARLTTENNELKAAIKRLEPKQGEIVRCKECIHFTQGGWCDREFDWFPVDENDFCSMAEKMEVQDGK